MFGLPDRQTQEVARTLYERATDAAARYVGLSPKELSACIPTDFPEPTSYVWANEVGFYFEDAPNFLFRIYWLPDPILSIQAEGGPYWGFMLQQSGSTWITALNKPILAPLGPKANRLAAHFEQQYGIRNPRKTIEKFRTRFR